MSGVPSPAGSPSSTAEAQAVSDRVAALSLFHDVERLRGRSVALLLHGGEQVRGSLAEYDETMNCVVERADGTRAVVLGKAIVGIIEQ